ncbi:MAG: GatB/YqeY domain-containing protein [Lentimicrobiaceae bacterium]|jgi:uncharacterized protein YqeY|nr:GatB/YqeY domain-containing protein [Lentimicrobiaceae bacterium]
MNLEIVINNDLKQAMLAKDTKKLNALRAIKAALLLEKTGKDIVSSEIPETVELKLLQKLVKQRKESAVIYTANNRHELAEEELYQASIIEAYLPKQLSDDDVRAIVTEIIAETGANSIKDMGKVMGLASKKIAGQADNKTISEIVKQLLNT